MSDFEFIIGFYGLLLGLALANTTTGVADLWRGRNELRVGFCVPLLALAIFTAVVLAWYSVWGGQGQVHVTPTVLLLLASYSLPYIFISQAMFPKKPEAWPSLDAYYLEHRAVLLGALMVAPIVGMGGNLLVGFGFNWTDWLWFTFGILLPAGLIFWRNRMAHIVGLALIAADNLARLYLPG